MNDVLFPVGVAQRIFADFPSGAIDKAREAGCVTGVAFSPMILR
jgi:hypothetical protein